MVQANIPATDRELRAQFRAYIAAYEGHEEDAADEIVAYLRCTPQAVLERYDYRKGFNVGFTVGAVSGAVAVMVAVLLALTWPT